MGEPEYSETMKVLRVSSKGNFGWKRSQVFLSEVLWGESVGLLPLDDRWYAVYFAHLPIASFDSWRRQVSALPKQHSFDKDEAREGEKPPSPAPHPQNLNQQKLSGMSPV